MITLKKYIIVPIILPFMLFSLPGPSSYSLAQSSSPYSVDCDAEAPEPIRTLGTDRILYQVSDVQLTDTSVIVLTSPEPAVHIFGEHSYRSWGRKGPGPGEFQHPADMGASGKYLFVLHTNIGANRIDLYALDGSLHASISLSRHMIVTRARAASDGFLFETTSMGGGKRHLLRVDRAGHQTQLISYSKPKKRRIAPSEGPSLDLPLPFIPTTEWTISADGQLAIWNGTEDAVTLKPLDGPIAAELPLPPNDRCITNQDREAWIDRILSSDVEIKGRRDPFRHVREKARTSLPIPDTFPRALDLRADPEAGVWALRTPATQGEIWMHLRSDQKPSLLHLPPRREVMDIGPERVAALATSQDGEEYVEIYRRHELMCTSVTR